jgi:aminoglycoside/choline kinase family phosphotransferase
VAALWERHEDLLRLAESAPPTVGHWDFWPANVFVGDDAVVAIDWSQVGIAGLTHDLDQLTLDPVWMQVLPGASLDELETAVLDGYLDGLREAGCDVAPDQVRRWYAATAAARYAWLAGGQPALVADPAAVAAQEHRFGRRFTEIAAEKARVVTRAVELGEWALQSRG